MPNSIPPSAVVSQPTDALKLNPRNARTHSKRQIRQIADSIRAFGFLNPILVDEAGMVLAGHGRLAAAKLLNLPNVPILLAAGLSDTQKRAYVLADNKLAEKAGWDRALLAVELGDLAELLPPLDWGLSLTGFESGEIDTILDDHEADPANAEDAATPSSGPAVTRCGDLWLLGSHRLLCGDARSREDIDRLMAGARADMVFTDPPYNVPIAGHVQGRGRVQHAEFAFASGEMSESAFERFLEDSLGQAVRVSREGAVQYVCMDWRHIATLIGVGQRLYGAMLNLCVWAKSNGGQGSFYRSQHELVGVFRAGDATHENNVKLGRFGRNRSNVWTYPGANGFGAESERADHPTPKPLALVADAIRDCTTRRARVLDPFLGSGTTLLAAEKVGRCGYGLEYEPRYVDVAIRRWQSYTGQDAVLADDGRPFDEVRAERLGEGDAFRPVRAGDAS